MTRTAVPSTEFRRDARVASFTKAANVAWGGAASSSLDVYYPAQTGCPVVIILHGSWCAATTWRSYPPLVAAARRFAENGFVAVLPDFLQIATCLAGNVDTSYRQGMITDAMALVTWARSNAGTYNGDTTKITLLGCSAGGQLAMMAGIQGVTNGSKPNTVVGWSPATNLADGANYDTSGPHDDAGAYMKDYLVLATLNGHATAQAFSPVNQISSAHPYLRIVGCGSEPDLGIASANFDAMHTAAQAAGVDSTKRVITGATLHADLASEDTEGSAAWVRSKTPWASSSGRSAAGTRAAAGSRAAA